MLLIALVFVGFNLRVKPRVKPKTIMNATVNVLCYRSKTLSNGEHPLMLRICKSGKKKYQSLKISVNPKNWDFEKEKPKRNCPNREFIESVISTNLEKVRKQILELNVENKDYTAQSHVTQKDKQVTIYTVGDFYKKLLKEMDQGGKYGNWRFYTASNNSLKAFTNGNLDFLFSEIDVAWLNSYEKWLLKRGNIGTTISVQFRTLRAIYNKAIELKCVNKSYYPFDNYKISKFDTTTKKRAISKEDIGKLKSVKLTDSKQLFARDIFVFSYLCGGINFVDIAHLKAENVVENRLSYIRHKTHKLISIQLLPEAKVILNKYAQNRSNNFVFPILDIKTHLTEKQKLIRIHNLLYKIDIELKTIAETVGIKVNLTTYVARHSFATVLKKSGVSIPIISEALGHSDLATTQIYLDSFDNGQMDEAMKNLI